jgi:hypothetical protein
VDDECGHADLLDGNALLDIGTAPIELRPPALGRRGGIEACGQPLLVLAWVLCGPAGREGRRKRRPDRLLERQPDDGEPDLERLRRQRLVVWTARPGPHEDERPNEVGPPQRERERDEAAHGMPADVAREPARIEH